MNSRKKIPNVDGAYTSSNTRGVPPARGGIGHSKRLALLAVPLAGAVEATGYHDPGGDYFTRIGCDAALLWDGPVAVTAGSAVFDEQNLVSSAGLDLAHPPAVAAVHPHAYLARRLGTFDRAHPIQTNSCSASRISSGSCFNSLVLQSISALFAGAGCLGVSVQG